MSKPPKELFGCKLVVNPKVPEGEIHFRDPLTGQMLAKIVNLRTGGDLNAKDHH